MKIIGWDIGGAHVKAYKINFVKKKTKIKQIYSPIWKNINNLNKSVKKIEKDLGKSDYHAVTMTAELSDIFKNRKNGSKKIINTVCKIFSNKKIFFYNNLKLFVKKKEALKKNQNINSMNWHASANFISNFYRNCIFVDIGSSTTDIIPIKKNKIIVKGNNDHKRLTNNELIYSGVIRTPINAITKKLKLKKKQNLINENFSNLGDVYRILNKLPKGSDLCPSLDKKSKTKHSSARRLARIFGKDYNKNQFKLWRKISIKIEEKQKKILKNNIEKIKKRNFKNSVPIITAGVGEFLVKDIYKNKNCFSFYSKIKNIKKRKVINCESAISVALLLRAFLKRKRSKSR